MQSLWICMKLPHWHYFLSKIFLTMRITAIILLAGFLQVSANGFSQERISLSAKNAKLEKLLEDIQKQSSHNIWYDRLILKNSLPVSCEIKDADIVQALDIIFKGQPFEYEIIGKNVVIKKKLGTENGFNGGNAGITGKVYDDQGEPVAGCTITVKGNRMVAVTESDGSFHIEGIDENAILIFSGSNVETHEENLNHRKEITLVLHKKINKLDEVQIIAYGTTTKRLNTGNVSTVKSEDISKQPVINVLSALEGRVPGLIVTQSTGVAGGSISVEIRGRNSIRTDGNQPLYIVDGVPFSSTPLGSSISAIINQGSPLASISPDEISSVEILKDADATAIYGSRGANGVVLITTKKGHLGKPKFDFNIYTG
ncbi:MAG TPA: TonB-dependent receptor plug domain-containing protein, partial [Puia sp.]|nr:TonB-dependent receptor plug domain-containing protein [Puia sp.]